MLQLTDKAAVHLQLALAELDPGEDVCFRLGITQDGPKIVIDQERPGDTPLTYQGQVLVVVDAGSVDRFDGHTMDFDETAEQLVFT